MRPLTVDVLRHGETELGPHRLVGSSDVALHDRGWIQMWKQVNALPGPRRPDLVISSPLRRCASFAAVYAGHAGIPLQVDTGWAEMDFGSWEGRDVRLLRGHADFRRFYAEPDMVDPPRGESFRSFRSRVLRALDRLTGVAAGHVLLITHGGVMRLLLCHVLQLDASRLSSFHLPHAAHARLRFHAGRAMLTLLNSRC